MKKILVAILFITAIALSQSIKKQSIYLHDYSLSENKINSGSNQVLNFEQKKKSPALAILFSALIPGMGEYYAGNYSSGKYFTIAEVSLWGIYAGMNYYQNFKKENSKQFAKSNAGVDLNGKDEDYLASIGEYKNIEQYNDDKAFNRLYNKMYDPVKYYWKWNSESDRKNYRNLWLSSQHAKNNKRFVVGAMVVNRLISIINAVRLVASYNKNLTEQTSWNIYLEGNENISSLSNISINFSTSF